MSTSPRAALWGVRLVTILGLLILIEAAARLRWVDPLTLVPVTRMVERLVTITLSGELWPHFAQTSGAVLLSVFLSVASGLPLGLLLWRARRLRQLLNPYLTAYYAIPIFVFYPLFISIFGMGLVPIVVIGWSWAVVGVVVNTAIGLEQIRPIYGKLAVQLGLTFWQRLRLVFLPAAAPHLFVGFKLAVIYGVIAVVASEFVLSTGGMGNRIAFFFNNFRVAEMYAYILLVLSIAIALTSALLVWEQRVRGRS
ncbi:MAG: ABC transporter permease [Dehalococcoidia bacterium]|nr:MAG: ABC transporter permease [Dehalococcoidia bacterium]